jgi:hypothetical protein
VYSVFIFVAQQPKSGPGHLIVEVSTHHTHTLGRTPLNELSAHCRGRYLHNTQQPQEMNIHALSGIRTCDPSNQAASYIRLRPHDHRDRPECIRRYENVKIRIVTWDTIVLKPSNHLYSPQKCNIPLIYFLLGTILRIIFLC